MVKAVFFDMDGVLVDSKSAWYNLFNSALKSFEKKTITYGEFEEHVWAQNFVRTAEKYFTVAPENIKEYFLRHYHEFQGNLVEFQDTAAALDMLRKKKLKLAVTTNTNHEQAVRILGDIRLLKYFDLVFGGDQVKHAKPEPDMLLKAIEELNLKKQEVIFVGDTVWDQQAAQRAGIRFVPYRFGEKKISNLMELGSIC